MAAALIQRRGRVLGSLTKASTFIENIDDDTSIEEVESRLQKLDSWWEEFCNIEDELLLLPQQNSKSDEFETKFFSVQAAMLHQIKKRKPNVSSNNDDLNSTLTNIYSQQKAYFDSLHNKTMGQTNEVKVPRINIPPFNGEYAQWPSFKDLFEATVHNNESLSRVHKFQLLKGLLQGSASRLINHFLITDASYGEAWDKLKQRYDKKRTLVSTIIKTFLDQPAINHASPRSLRDITETSDELLRGLKALGPDGEARDPWILYLLLNKMDNDTRQQWALHSVAMDAPSIGSFFTFFHQRCDALESCNITIKPPKPFPKVSHVASAKVECRYCNKPHLIHRCYKFQRCDIEFRKRFINKHDLCTNCLKEGHSVVSCPSTNTCFKCKEKHHTVLHDGNSNPVQNNINANIANKDINTELSVPGPSTSADSQSYTIIKRPLSGNKQSILPTVIMSTVDTHGNIHNVRALLDSGSESSFITEALTKKLGLRRKHASITINGLASTSAGVTRGTINIKLSSRYNEGQFVEVCALILGKLTNYLPSQAIILQENHMAKLHGFCLADPEFFEPNHIDMILGIDVFYDVVKERRIMLEPNLFLLDSLFGWIVAGSVNQRTNSTTGCYTVQINSEDICKLLRRFWEVEEISSNIPNRDDPCEEHFSSTHKFTNGRYLVELPLKSNSEQLGRSLKAATSRMIAMERKFQRDSHLKDEYTKFMREYEKLGHMSRIPNREVLTETSKVYYLPHHAVFKESPTSKKLRVVFDGSCKSTTGLSLNDVLMTGPTIQDDLFSILTRFRKHKFAFVSDIEKMYRQIAVHPKHQNYQRIVWRENPNTEMQHFKLTTVTYGLTCSAYLAIRSLHQIRKDNEKLSCKLSEIIKSDFYVDDLLSGCDSIEEAIKLYTDLSTTLSHAGFILRKWSSNCPELLNKIPIDKRGGCSISFEDPEVCIKTLGICWLTNEDAFTFSVPELRVEPSTKRRLLSECGKIFDPLGWLSPATITFKILLQSLWLTKIGWDDPLPDHINRAWSTARNELICLSGIRIQRFLQMQSIHTVQFHGFCDASEKAYSAVVYARSTNSTGNSSVHLIAAKTKVSPLKQLSIPRLELCGAVLLTKLLIKIAGIFEASPDTLYAWSDSNVVLSWLSDVPRKWNCFVGNRTSFIIDQIPRSHWQHVPTKVNPADCASRGLSPSELLKHKIWWNGPEFLQKSTYYWPNYENAPSQTTTIERRKNVLTSTNAATATVENWTIKYVLDKFSSYTLMLRAVSSCIRFAELCRKMKVPHISSQHLQRSENLIIKYVQHDAFNEEILQLQKNKSIKRSSNLLSLFPIIDEDGLLRVGGRLINSNIGYSKKHPLILPKQHQFTEMLIRHLHFKYLHPNPSTLLFITRSKYWIIGARDIVKKVSKSCVFCIKSHPRLGEQIMGNLPSPRVTLIRAFTNVGVDYAGPITISSKKGRGSKRLKAYICLFVCMATKAIHLEVVSDLSTDAFLASLKRFAGRRGVPNAIYSDNATNFVGARRKFDEFFRILSSKTHNEKVSAYLGSHSIEWHTIPPSAPHFGGLWEAGVKSIKTHLRRVLGESAPTFEEMQTLLIQIEAIVNSRPLTATSNDPDDLNILTPGHFLIGCPILEVPDKYTDDIKLKLSERWELLQNMSRGFWKRWHLEYLTSLQKRSKWQHQQQNFKQGDLVLIKDENASSLTWARGRVIKVHPSPDGSVRVVTLKTSTGEIKRPIAKLCKLMIE